MKRIIRNISLCALLAVAMGACEEEAALVNPSVAHDNLHSHRKKLLKPLPCKVLQHREVDLSSVTLWYRQVMNYMWNWRNRRSTT